MPELPSGQPLRVLIVEHNAADVELLVAALRQAGFDVQADVAETRQQLLTKLRATAHDVVLADYRLPSWTGLDALAALRELGLDMPFILVTGAIGEEEAVEAMKRGVTDYVLKDRLQRLPQVVRRALDEHEDREARKQAEEALRGSEVRYRSLVENATYGVCYCGTDGHFLTVNPALLRMLGYSTAAEVMALDLDRDVFVDPGVRQRYFAALIEADRIPPVEADWKQKGGTTITVRLSGRAVRDGGQLSGFELFAEDVTARWVVEERTRQMQKMEAVGELTGGIAHDFNNLLTIISANAELIELELPSSMVDLRSEIADLRAAARRGSAMIRKLMTFSREADIDLVPIDLSALVLETGAMLRRLLPESIEIHTDVGSDTAAIMGDPGAIEQAIVNLGTNARDAMAGGGRLDITLRAKELDDAYLTAVGAGVAPGRYICISVTDNGSGMDERTRQKLFEPFFTTKAPDKGTGLGMAMVYGIIKHHGGFINVYSELKKGTTIRVHFPVASEVARAIPEEQPSKPRGRGETILVVEDEEMIRSSARRILERYGYRVLLASDGEEALVLLRAPDCEIRLVLSDVVMPRLSGRHLYQAVQRERIPVRFIYTSGYTALDARETAALDSSVPFLPKPWIVAELLNRIRSVLDAE